MNMNLVGIAGVPAQDMSGKLVGVGGCGCNAGMGAYARPVGETSPTPEQAQAFRWIAVGLLGVAAIGLWWMESRRHA
jgi:hypothetical protein